MQNRTHRYDLGQKLLCFEPDSSKAKLIYYAKILKHVKNKSGTPHYGVHFHGWKCKWDREVSEDLLLENNEFNRTLKRKIDEVARNVRGRYQRKQRIDMILEWAAMSGDDIDWHKVPGVWKGIKSNRKPKPLQNSPRISALPQEFSVSLLDQEQHTQFQFEQLQIHKSFLVKFTLPRRLLDILKSHFVDSDHSAVSVSKKFPYWCSVLQLLQKYVDDFPYNGLTVPTVLNYGYECGSVSSDRVSRTMSPLYLQCDHSRLLCAEVCSSLRVLFDSTFNSYLLSPSEKTHELKDLIGRLRNGGMALHPFQTNNPKGVEPIYRLTPRYALLPDSEVELYPNLPSVNCPPHFLLRLFVILPTLLDGMQLTTCRRAIIDRHLYLLIKYMEHTLDYWFGEMPFDHQTELPIKGPVATTHSESSGDTEPQTNNIPISEHPYVYIKTLANIKLEPIDSIPCSIASPCTTTPSTKLPPSKARSTVTDSEDSSISTDPAIKPKSITSRPSKCSPRSTKTRQSLRLIQSRMSANSTLIASTRVNKMLSNTKCGNEPVFSRSSRKV